MKRSEVLKIIVTELNKHYESRGLETAGIAHDILFRIEEKGMLPPLDKKKYYNSYEAEQDIYGYVVRYHKWEKE